MMGRALGVVVGEWLDLFGLRHVEELGGDAELLERVLELRVRAAVQLGGGDEVVARLCAWHVRRWVAMSGLMSGDESGDEWR